MHVCVCVCLQVITDFGLSDMQGASVASGALTVHISPPEVLLNPRAPRSESTDVYALGIVMLELLLGRHCYTGMNRADIVRTVVSCLCVYVCVCVCVLVCMCVGVYVCVCPCNQ